jgi:large subunit ribosomal protein L24
MASRVRHDDTVQVIRGKDKGKRGKVQRVDLKESMVHVEGVNIVKRHLKAGAQGAASQGGIISQEKPMGLARVMLVCPNCDKPTRVGYQVLEDGTKSRVCKRCDQTIS